ncbi:MAG: TraB/GumN family protein [Pseudomonadota bacterium]
MKRLAFAILAGCAWLLSACSAAAETGPALWHIHDADSDIWLFGSVHVLPPQLQWRTERISAAFAQADELMLETDAASPEGQAVFVTLTRQLGLLPAGETLSKKLDPQVLTRWEAATRQVHMTPAQLDGARPWLASIQISMLYAMAHGQDPNSGVDNVFYREAVQQGKRVAYFETPEQQIRFLSDLPPEDEMKLFVATIDDIEHDDDSTDEAQDAWVHGDVRRLARVVDTDLRSSGPVVYRTLITNRNAHWVEEIIRRLHGAGHTFIVVGAGHLAGDGSVIALLRARGIHVDGP